MTSAPATGIITADGEFQFGIVTPGSQALIEFDISEGSATVTVGTVGLGGAFRASAQADGTAHAFAAAGGQAIVTVGASGRPAIKVASAAALSMRVGVTRMT